MKKKIFFTLFILAITLLISCSTNRTLIEKKPTEDGIAKFYVETDLKDKSSDKRLIAIIDNKIYYSFYPNKIVKQTKENKNLIYTLYYENLPENYDNTAFQKLSATDNLILSNGNQILNSLNWTDYKKSFGASAFVIEVNYYHGYPKNKKFEP